MVDLNPKFAEAGENQDTVVRFTRAVEPYEFEGAFRCIYRSYLARGLTPHNRYEMRLTRHHLLPTTRVLIARIGRQVVGTLSLVENEPLGVPICSAFRSHVDELSRSSERIAEATCLAAADAPLSGLELVHHLMGLAAQAASRRGVSRILIAVHPRHVSFYERAVGFRVFASARPYPSVGGRPAVALQLNLRTLHMDRPDVFRRYFGMSFSASALSSESVPSFYLNRIAALWRSLHGEGGDLEAAVTAQTDRDEIAA
jgi:hypothetical protein